MKKKILLSSALVILICISLIAGATFALFTSEQKVTMVVGSAKVAIQASIGSLQLYSMDRPCQGTTFENLGTANLDGNTLTISNMSPGDKVEFTINVANSSNIATKCTMRTEKTGGLADVLVVEYSTPAATLAPETGTTVTVSVELPKTVDNDYQEKGATLTFFIEAVQGNG